MRFQIGLISCSDQSLTDFPKKRVCRPCKRLQLRLVNFVLALYLLDPRCIGTAFVVADQNDLRVTRGAIK